MAHIRRRERTDATRHSYVRWTATFKDPADPTRIRTKTFARKSDAEEFLSRLDADTRQGTWVDPDAGKLALAAFARRWLDGAGNLAPSTRHRYRSIIDRHIIRVLGHRELASLKTTDVRAFVADLSDQGLAPKTIRHAYALLMEILRSAADDRLIGTVPQPPRSARRRLLPKVPAREQRILSAEELHGLAAAMPSRYRIVPPILGYAGLRWSELAALRPENLRLLERRIDITGGLVEVNGRLAPSPGKTTGSVASLRIPASLAEAIGEHMAAHPPGRDGYLVQAPRGGPVRYSAFYRRVWIPALQEVNLGSWVPVESPLGRPSEEQRFVPAISPHGLRHTAVALAIESGAHPKAIQELARHATIAMTFDVYGHLFETAHDELAERLDETWRRAASGPGPDQDRPAEVRELPAR